MDFVPFCAACTQLRHVAGRFLQAEAKKRRLEELKNSNKGKAAADSRSWGAALQMAQGEKVRDDPKLLKKTLQRKLKQKQKSTKEW